MISLIPPKPSPKVIGSGLSESHASINLGIDSWEVRDSGNAKWVLQKQPS